MHIIYPINTSYHVYTKIIKIFITKNISINIVSEIQYFMEPRSTFFSPYKYPMWMRLIHRIYQDVYAEFNIGETVGWNPLIMNTVDVQSYKDYFCDIIDDIDNYNPNTELYLDCIDSDCYYVKFLRDVAYNFLTTGPFIEKLFKRLEECAGGRERFLAQLKEFLLLDYDETNKEYYILLTPDDPYYEKLSVHHQSSYYTRYTYAEKKNYKMVFSMADVICLLYTRRYIFQYQIYLTRDGRQKQKIWWEDWKLTYLSFITESISSIYDNREDCDVYGFETTYDAFNLIGGTGLRGKQGAWDEDYGSLQDFMENKVVHDIEVAYYNYLTEEKGWDPSKKDED